MREIVLIDGGMGQELLNRSTNQAPRHWSAEYLLTEPDLVRAVHRDYIAAGARVITVNTYAATYTRMAMVQAEDRVPELQRTACELALRARDEADASAMVAVAGCLPPLNGTYRPDRVRAFEVNLAEYRRLAAHQAPYVDLFVCETLSTADEARAAATAATETGKPVWVSWSLVDAGGRSLRSGESIAHAHRALEGLGVRAVLANCTAPESITAAMPELVATGLPAGGYANGFVAIPQSFLPGRTREQLSAREDLGPAAYGAFAMEWVALGATIVGGCCEVGPAHIAHLRDALLAAGHALGSADLATTRAGDAPEVRE
ncbi:MAG: homocysteine S-methyltransferase family protein [Ectothiorhodospiraceae bacterium]|nr:homocysteine S-methyltransferase family protein [Chromatiales bacterium]MCP5154825.1 homocysteine S-methyltransferase family protein [Ectothiorhodospiraceae bacterium]